MNAQFGVTIHQGPQAWTILQQKEGFAHLELAGGWAPPQDGSTEGKVYVRIVKEETSEDVIEWSPAETDQTTHTWTLRLDRIPAGGLYRLETSLQMDGKAAAEWFTRGDMVHHLGVGDLWVIAGQSNAAGYGKGPVNDPPEFGIHLLRHDGHWDLATHPFNDSTHSIHTQNREGSNPGHSPFLSFARFIKRATGWPVGLIPTAHGGSPLSRWNPQQDGTLYRMMLDVVRSAGGSIRGVLWYQGCSDCEGKASQTYLPRFRNMVESIRHDLDDASLPVLTVQLNRHTTSTPTAANDISWGTLREHQRRAAHVIPHVTVIPALDSPMTDEIHNSPAGNLLIGERMARAALAVVYGHSVHYLAPEISSAVLQKQETDGRSIIELTFDHVKGYLLSTGPLEPVFTVQDEDGLISVTSCTITGKNVLQLVLPRPLCGEAFVHGAYEQNPASRLPLDSGTYMPLLGFYQYPLMQGS